jgi:hypothetical protein
MAMGSSAAVELGPSTLGSRVDGRGRLREPGVVVRQAGPSPQSGRGIRHGLKGSAHTRGSDCPQHTVHKCRRVVGGQIGDELDRLGDRD